ncbi:MAG: hypothetical protein BWK73_34100 [Thiothrix lacustris]|uniref:TIR domain-containing protein n=1 Tax=Thiothrix lacustris TaxID=525917 RepID=A0A1Y1QGU0_9GAMM|nr:MAG: hypothetical protein BWK73_34100 [Thiothrix lacustris]
MHDIFLSYSTKDRERLQPLFQALERQGWSVFWDHRTIDIGEHWSKKINHAIRTSKCVVVVWSKASVESDWVLEEANIGKQRKVFLPIQIDEVDFPVGFTMLQAGNFIHWNGDVNDPQFIRLAEKIRELVEQHDTAQAKREAAETAEQERLAQEKSVADQQARDHAEQQRRLEEEARLRREAAETTERERLAKEKAVADQKAREATERQRWLEESQARLAVEEAAKQKKLAQERAAEQKAREEAEQQAKARADQLKREQAAAEEKARKEAARQAKINQAPSAKKFPLIPALLLSTAVLGGGGYYWYGKGNSAVGASPAGDSSVQQTDSVKKESLAGQAPTAVIPASDVPEPEMVSIPAGTFTMGCDGKRDDVEGGCSDDEKPAHKVSISAFQMAKTEVTFDQWDACEKAEVCPHAEDEGWGRGNLPVINVSWDDITQKYIPWLNKETGKTYRLPTEAEWEYAARGGTDTAYSWGNAIWKGNVNCDNSACGDKFDYTAPVGSFAANGYGLHDMNGNVWEWCQDWYTSDYYASSPASNPKGAVRGASRVLRGGSWFYDAQYVRSAYRLHFTPGYRFNFMGFRLVLP